MKAEAFAKSIDELYEQLKLLTASKGEEYKRREDNQFANFERGAQALGLTREQVLMVYLSKHLDSIVTYVKDRAAGQEKVYAEPISGRIDDAILYLLLLRGMTIENDEAYGRRVAAAIFPGETFEVPEFEERSPCSCGARYDNIQNFGGLELTPGPSPTVGCPTFVISRVQPDAIAECQTRALPVATSALSTTDQLHGVRPGGHVVFIHHGNGGDDAMLREVRDRCTKQGLTHEVIYR